MREGLAVGAGRQGLVGHDLLGDVHHVTLLLLLPCDVHDPIAYFRIGLHEVHGLLSVHGVGAAQGGQDLLHLAPQHRGLQLRHPGDGHLPTEVEARRLAHCYVGCRGGLFGFAESWRNIISSLLQASRGWHHHPTGRWGLWGVCLAWCSRSTLAN